MSEKLDIQVERHLKIGRHKDLIAMYKTQLNQLVTLIKQREASIDRIQLAVDTEDMHRARAFNIKVSRAKDDALSCPLAVGDRFRSGPEFFNVAALKNEVIGVIRESDQHCVVSGKSLETISEFFYYEYPAAVQVNSSKV
jgi:hypothetical protein